jgi:hypothetical protein
VDFHLNKDCIMDLALTEFLLDAAVEASRVLGADEAERKRWAEIRANLAPYPQAQGPYGKVWIDVVNAPVDPAETIEIFEFMTAARSAKIVKEILHLADMIRWITGARLPENKILRYSGLIHHASRKHRVNPLEIIAIIMAESEFKENSVNVKTGDYGLARLSGFVVAFDQNPCKFKPRVPKVFTTGSIGSLHPRPSPEGVADWVKTAATASAVSGSPAPAGYSGT